MTEPAGLLPSNFAKIMLLVLPGQRCKRTSGVLPTNCSMVGNVMSYQFFSVSFMADKDLSGFQNLTGLGDFVGMLFFGSGLSCRKRQHRLTNEL